MSIMDRAKRTVCNVLGHTWKHTMTVGTRTEKRRSFRCERCNERKVTVNDVTLAPEDAQPVLDDMAASVRAHMWLLDNVTPTYSAERIDGKTVIKHNGEIVGDRRDG